jgi:hypothetical protein
MNVLLQIKKCQTVIIIAQFPGGSQISAQVLSKFMLTRQSQRVFDLVCIQKYHTPHGWKKPIELTPRERHGRAA